MIKKHFLIIFFLFNIGALWILYTYNDSLQYQTIKKTAYKNYDINKESSESVSSDIKDVDMSFLLKIDSPDKVKNDVVDIFRTGPQINALSMRLIKPGSLQVVTGYTNSDKHKVFALTDLFEYGKLHTVKIKIYKEKQIWILLNDVLVINTNDNNIYFDISKIQIGKEFGGTISDISLTYALYRKSALISIMKFVLFLTFIATCFTLIKKNFIFLSREERIQRVAFLLFVGFLLAIFYHVGQSVLGYSDPKNTFLFTPGNMFTDFIGPVNNPDIITYSFFTTIVKRLFYSIGLEMSLILFITGSIMFLTLIHIHEITIKTSNIFSTATIVIFSLLNYPALYVINRGNLEMLIFLLLYAFSYFLAKKNFMVSALFLAIAISMKLFPAVFLIVFLSYKEYKAFIYACFLTVFLNIASLAIIVGGKTKNLSMVLSEGIGQYTGGYVKEYVIDNRGLDFGHSLYGLLKLRIFSFHKSASITDVTLPEVTRLFKMYSSLELSIFAILSTYIIFIEKELWKKITLLTISMNLLPYVSADYKLIQFFIPLYLFINKKEKSRTDILYVILFSLLLVPKNYFNIIWNLPDVSFGIFLNPVVMIVLAVLIIGEGLRSTYLENSVKVFAKADLKLR